ncbi:MarR family winged helix-turn-helix transcriptional regulator [Chitinophaga sedimenti]|uniref:MarR family winged helix-turn-helix transcriptional regulator n=1 Tax=Chitinophaga sedimenti TaxID=2033606 RepID=UPI0035560A49
MQIINRLIQQGWAQQVDSATDKRSKIISITAKGMQHLEQQMEKIRLATQVVTGDLTHQEKMELITLLNKLDHFHRPIFQRNAEPGSLLEMVVNEYLPAKS